jgi:hypothetical protein
MSTVSLVDDVHRTLVDDVHYQRAEILQFQRFLAVARHAR